ncbi:MAG: hypothetical protein D6730_08915 [Bacteroidetes bacterium]|nr:MAG: hypothetical protein D6730_08915 [Bacteroidota bacterium]
MKLSVYKSLILALLLAGHVCFGQKIDMSLLGGMSFRSIGPAGMSGRVTAIAVVERNPSEIFIGSASGGLWKSENAGTNWTPIFEGQPVASIGDIAIFQKNPSIIYVGTGEGNPRNSQSSGNGMYKSIDGGKSWKHLGLEASRNIHRVLVHPENPDIVYAGVIGPAWAPTPQRGVYKSTDGGKSWKQILFVNDTTGVADMVMDPTNPNKLIVAMWQYQRWPWFFKSGGPGSGIHLTLDGGENWTRLTATNGLPAEELGRIGLAIAPSNPKVVYALVESKKNALYRSEDGGNSWKMVADKNIGDRPFYYSDIFVDPTNENRLYNLSTQTMVSEDGGKTFRSLMGFFQVHSDHHAFWINPRNPQHLLDGNDGGLYASMDGGKSWRFHHNLPLGQFYHINVDNELPYNVLGGLQDNGSWSGPAYKWQLLGSIRNHDFRSVGFGDGFDVLPDPQNARFGYSLFQGGMMMRYDKEKGLIKLIKPADPPGQKLRFNWNAGIAQDPFDPATIYLGSQFVHKSTNKGSSWDIISPDLTTNDPQKQRQAETGGLTIDNTTAENHTTILVIEPSPLEKGLIWVGTDDGNVQITRDGGASWKNVVSNIKGLPANSWICQIKASRHQPGTAFLIADNHRYNDWTPYVYKTTNYGKSWKPMLQPDEVWGYALSIAEDPEEARLLFLGTEFGLYVSIDGGENWTKWKADFPTASAMDMVIHPREHDLVVGTFGRSVYILDDIRPLRELAQAYKPIMNATVHVSAIPDAYQAMVGMPGFFSGSSDVFAGQNRPLGAMISYWAKEKSGKDSVQITIKDASGAVFRQMKTTAAKGLNRTFWDLKKEPARYPGPPDPFSGFFSQAVEAPPGTYNVLIQIGEQADSQQLNILPDPGLYISEEEFQTNLQRKARFQQAIATTAQTFKKIDEAGKALKKFMDYIEGRKGENLDALKKEGKALYEQIDSLRYQAIAKPSKGIAGDTDELVPQLQNIGMYYFSSMTPPTQNEEAILHDIEQQIAAYQQAVDDCLNGELKAFQQRVEAAALKWFPEDP